MDVRLYILAGTFALVVVAFLSFFASIVAAFRRRRAAKAAPSFVWVDELPPNAGSTFDTSLDGLDVRIEPGTPQAALLLPLRAGEWQPPVEPAPLEQLQHAALSERVATFHPAPDVPEPAFSVERYEQWEVPGPVELPSPANAIPDDFPDSVRPAAEPVAVGPVMPPAPVPIPTPAIAPVPAVVPAPLIVPEPLPVIPEPLPVSAPVPAPAAVPEPVPVAIPAPLPVSASVVPPAEAPHAEPQAQILVPVESPVQSFETFVGQPAVPAEAATLPSERSERSSETTAPAPDDDLSALVASLEANPQQPAPDPHQAGPFVAPVPVVSPVPVPVVAEPEAVVAAPSAGPEPADEDSVWEALLREQQILVSAPTPAAVSVPVPEPAPAPAPAPLPPLEPRPAAVVHAEPASAPAPEPTPAPLRHRPAVVVRSAQPDAEARAEQGTVSLTLTEARAEEVIAEEVAAGRRRVRPDTVPEVQMAAPIEMWFGDSRVGVRAGSKTYDQFRRYADVLFDEMRAVRDAKR